MHQDDDQGRVLDAQSAEVAVQKVKFWSQNKQPQDEMGQDLWRGNGETAAPATVPLANLRKTRLAGLPLQHLTCGIFQYDVTYMYERKKEVNISECRNATIVMPIGRPCT